MITSLAGIVGPKLAKPVFGILLVLAIIAGTLIVAKCTGRDDTAQRQAEQTGRSGEAIGKAGADAVEAVSDRAKADNTTDAAGAATAKEIEHAQSPDDVRDAVLRGVCGQHSHRNDPACRVRRSNP